MELSNQHYLGNDGANPFYYYEKPIGIEEGIAIYEGDICSLLCVVEDKDTEDIPF